MVVTRQGPARDAKPLSGSGEDALIVKIVGALIFSVGAPYFVGAYLFEDFAATVIANQTALACAVAVALSALINRNLSTYPGTQANAFVAASVATAFLVLFAVLLLLRISYSRFLLVSSATASLIYYYAFALRSVRLAYRIGIVPFGDVDGLKDIADVEWVELDELSRATQPLSAVVADLRADLPPYWDTALADFALAGVPVYHVKLLKESLTGAVELEHLSENSFGSLTPTFAYFQIKRAIDLVIALILIVVLAPVFLIAAAIVRFDTKGPAIFRQKRVGYRGKPFTVYKFRTMIDSALGNGDRKAAETQPNDSRITRIGRFYRKVRIDELPQLWNVVRGEMSLIGPRPEAEVLSLWYEGQIPFYRYRHVILPGITGWAQVNQGHVTDVSEIQGKLNYDFYYIKYFSPWLDLLIAAKTVKTVFTGFGHR
jgi:lipopolysaccharide/colanic/teichoic acid biosynthesis glycosyltransferase